MTQTHRLAPPGAAPPAADPHGALPSRPYPGVRPFKDSDADFFWGRDAEREIIIANLLAARLTVLYGPSGVGKTSLLRAGVVHELEREDDTDRDPDEPRVLAVVVARWDGDPAARIMQCAYDVASRRWPDEAGDPIPAEEPLDRALAELGVRVRAQILLILDQFEELFVYHPEGTRSRLDDELPSVVVHSEVAAHVLISLRDDALAGLDRFKGRIPGLFENRLALAPLSVSSARIAIERPLERFNELRGPDARAVTLEPGLADEVVGQLSGHRPSRGGGRGGAAEPPDAAYGIEPAYLQLVMARLWDSEREVGSSVMRKATLHALGDAKEIIRRHVEEATNRLPRGQQDVAARAFRYLVTPSGGKVALTAADLALYTDVPQPALKRVLETLAAGDNRILRVVPAPSGSSEGRAFEIFHDALATPVLEWSRRLHEQRLQRRVRRLRICLAAAIAIAAALATFLLNPPPLERAELQIDDLRFAVRGASPADPGIVIVAVDDRSVNASGGYPLFRSEQAQTLERVLAGRPRAVAIDLTFETASDDDAALERAIAGGNRKVVLATFDTARDPTLFGHRYSGLSSRLHAQLAYTGVPTDRDGELRHVDKYAPRPRDAGPSAAAQAPRRPTLGVLTARLAGWRTDLPKHAWIDYRGPERTFRTISHVDVRTGRVPPEVFRGKVVVIGQTATGRQVPPALRDQHPTPANGGSTLTGPEIQAHILSTIHRGAPLRDVPKGVVVALIVVLGALGAGLGFVPVRWRAPAIGLGVLLIAVAAQLSFNAGWVLPVIAPVAVFVLAALGSLLAESLGHRRRLERRA
jgi:CHASE2 domain-containing sensor protein